MTKDPFDFADLSDLPEELASKLHTDTTDMAREYANVVIKGAEAGYDELNINQIIAAATRMGMEPPTQQTVRGYLNKAVELKLIRKPSRQTYGINKGKTAKEDVGLDTSDDAIVFADGDPLADLPTS